MFLDCKTLVENQSMKYNRTSTKSVLYFMPTILEPGLMEDLEIVSMFNLAQHLMTDLIF